MADFYFKPFPEIHYDVDKTNNPLLATNILRRFKIKDIVVKNSILMFDYTIREGDRPDIVSNKHFGRPDLDWLILLSNNAIDPYYHWPLHYYEFQRYLIHEYGSIEAAKQKVHSYWRICQQRQMLYDGTIVPEKAIRVDFNTYFQLADEERRIVYAYDHEETQNEKRREIKIIKSEFVPKILTELETLL